MLVPRVCSSVRRIYNIRCAKFVLSSRCALCSLLTVTLQSERTSNTHSHIHFNPNKRIHQRKKHQNIICWALFLVEILMLHAHKKWFWSSHSIQTDLICTKSLFLLCDLLPLLPRFHFSFQSVDKFLSRTFRWHYFALPTWSQWHTIQTVLSISVRTGFFSISKNGNMHQRSPFAENYPLRSWTCCK